MHGFFFLTLFCLFSGMHSHPAMQVIYEHRQREYKRPGQSCPGEGRSIHPPCFESLHQTCMRVGSIFNPDAYYWQYMNIYTHSLCMQVLQLQLTFLVNLLSLLPSIINRSRNFIHVAIIYIFFCIWKKK